jgi:hypothetical protein
VNVTFLPKLSPGVVSFIIMRYLQEVSNVNPSQEVGVRPSVSHPFTYFTSRIAVGQRRLSSNVKTLSTHPTFSVLLGVFAKMRKATVNFMSALPSTWKSAPIARISLNLTAEYFSKICPENSSLIQI